MPDHRAHAHAYAVAKNVWDVYKSNDVAKNVSDIPESNDAHQVLEPLLRMEHIVTLPRWKNRRLECFVDPVSKDLGPYLRWLVALKVLMRLQHRPDVPWPEIIQKYEARRSVNLMLSSKVEEDLRMRGGLSGEAAKAQARQVMEPYAKTFLHGEARPELQRYLHGELFEALIRVLRAELAGRPGRLTRELFLSVANVGNAGVGPGTLLRFEHWLLHGVHPPQDDLQPLQCEKFLLGRESDNARRRQLREVTCHVLQGDASRPILNLYQRSSWYGLQAFATTFIHGLVTQRRTPGQFAVVYVPLSGGGGAGHVPGLRSLVAALQRVFGVQPGPEHDGEDRLPNLAHDLDAVRRGLSLCRTVVVFDALDNSVGPMSALFEAIKNTAFHELLSVLVQPHLEVARARNEDYPSRFVVLSGERLVGLEAWSAPAQPLALPPDDVDVRTLFGGNDPYAHELAAARADLGLRAQASHRRALYALGPEQLDAVFEQRAPTDVPNETDLALACMLSGPQIRACHDSARRQWQAEPDRGTAPPAEIADARIRVLARRAMFGQWLRRVAADDPIGLLALAFIGASINGMRHDTLERCMRDWLALWPGQRAVPEGQRAAWRCRLEAFFDRSPAQDVLPSSLRRLATVYRTLVVEGTSERVEAIGTRQFAYELQQFPDSAEAVRPVAGRAPMDSTRAEGMPNIDVRQDDLRELFFAELSTGQERLLPGDEAWPTWRQAWELIHYVIGAECLRQAATQLRNQPLRNFDTSASLRRLVQCVFHGLLSHPYDAADEDARALLPPAGGLALPPDPVKRYRYIYGFVFRHGIENAPEWSLGRAYAKTELRFALTALFASPAWGRDILAHMHAWDADMRAMRHGDAREQAGGVRAASDDAPADATPGDRVFPLDQLLDRAGRWLDGDAALQLDVMQALGRSAFDAGRTGFARALADRMLSEGADAPARAPRPQDSTRSPIRPHSPTEAQLRAVEASVARLRRLLDAAQPGREARHVEHRRLAFGKLLVDTLLVGGQAARAREPCEQWLRRQDVDATALQRLGRDFLAPNAQALAAPDGKTLFEATLQRILDPLTQAATRNARVCVALSDMLSRLGQIAAGEADADGETPWHDRLGEFLDAYAFYWLADRLRSDAGNAPERMSWPMVSAIPMRWHIRVSFKIARILAKQWRAGGPDAREACRAFYAHGRGRLDVYSRHLFRLPRERVSMLLLMATAARVWADLALEDAPDAALPHLAASLQYIDEAQSVLLELGMPRVMSSRFFFERVKTLRRLAKHDTAHSEQWRRLARSDLAVLDGLVQGNAFYERLLRRCALPAPSGMPGADAAMPKPAAEWRGPVRKVVIR